MNILEFIAGVLTGASTFILLISIILAWKKSKYEDEIKAIEERSEQLQMFCDELTLLRERIVGMNIVEFCREYQKIIEKYKI